MKNQLCEEMYALLLLITILLKNGLGKSLLAFNDIQFEFEELANLIIQYCIKSYLTKKQLSKLKIHNKLFMNQTSAQREKCSRYNISKKLL